MKRYCLILVLPLIFFCSCAKIPFVRSGAKVQTGLDIMVQEDFARLADKRVGLISNHSALDSSGKNILDLMLGSANVRLQAIFAPEHGFQGTAEEQIKDTTDAKSGLVIYSLYSEAKRPTKEQMKNIDVFVFDIQDIGARFYTYIATLAMCMEEAANNTIPFIVLDRPNPITGLRVDGPIQDKDLYLKFTSYFPMPIIHGMTIGEVAKMFNEYYGIQCDLTVVQMKGWKRKMFFDETGLPWVNPSPNIRSVTQEILYPAIALAEASDSNVSVGRGTDTPFEVFGAPFINAEQMALELNSRGLPGVQFLPYDFIPNANKFKDEQCHGCQIILTDRSVFDPIGTGLNLVSALYKLYPETYQIDPNVGLIGSKDVIQRIKQGEAVPEIRASYQKDLNLFIKIRNDFLLYKE